MSLNSTSCWEILNLKPTNDKKLIKQAYHKLLRVYKPDESPNEFKIIYQAYKDALNSNTHSTDTIDKTLSNPIDIKTSTPTDNILKDSYYNELQVTWSKFKSSVDDLTYHNKTPETFNKIENWSFIEDLNLIRDIELYQNASEYLFYAISKFDKKNPRLLLNNNVIHYLDNTFLWKRYWEAYDSSSSLFEYLEVKKIQHEDLNNSKFPIANLKKSIIAFFIDITVITIMILIFRGLSINITTINNLLVNSYIILYFFFFYLLNIRTPGQVILRLKVLEGEEYTEPSQTARGIRTFITILLILSIQHISTNILSPDPSAIIYISFIVISYLYYKKPLQDKLSATRTCDLSSFAKD